MADGAGVRFDLERDRMPVQPGVEAVCDAVDLDPWTVTSAGSLVATVEADRAEGVVAALTERGTPAAVVGTVSSGDGIFVDGEQLAAPDADPAWDVFARLDGA